MLDELAAVDHTRIAAVILDISSRNTNGISRLDTVKKHLSECFIKHWAATDLIYITTNADRDRLPKNRAEGLAWIADFVPSQTMKLGLLFKHATEMISESDCDSKIVLVITDRYKTSEGQIIMDAANKAEKRGDGTVFFILDIGGQKTPIMQEIKSKWNEYVFLFKTTNPENVGGFFESVITLYSGVELPGKASHDGEETREDTQIQAIKPEPILPVES